VHWYVDHCVGPLGVGSLIVKPKRHVVHIADLDVDEGSELGPVLQQASAVVTELVRPDQVYVTLWSHAGGEPGHIHFVVQPVTRGQMDELGLHGPRLQVEMFKRGIAPDPDAAAEFAARARGVWPA
jgi:diadenosine tetraphosphate (Ap4A) HIT family hydrolase